MKLLLSVGAIALTLAFSAYAEPQKFTALLPDPDTGSCFGLLRLESLQIDTEKDSVRINVHDPNQMELFARHRGCYGLVARLLHCIKYFWRHENWRRDQRHHTKRVDALDIQLLPVPPKGQPNECGFGISESTVVKNSVNDPIHHGKFIGTLCLPRERPQRNW